MDTRPCRPQPAPVRREKPSRSDIGEEESDGSSCLITRKNGKGEKEE